MTIINQSNSIAVPPPTTAIQTAPRSLTPNVSAISRIESENQPKSEEQIKQAVQKIQSVVDNLTQNLRFTVDEDTGKTIIKVMDTHTEEVIRQIPTEEAVEIARTLDKVQGLLFNGKA